MPDIKKLKFFAISFKGTDKNIGNLDNFFSLSPIVMYLPIKLQDTMLKKLIIIAIVITIIESLTKNRIKNAKVIPPHGRVPWRVLNV